MKFWRDLFLVPSGFDNDPYGELTNQAAHTFAGVVATIYLLGIWTLISGEAPYRSWLFFSVLIPYALVIEWALQKWKKRDSRFDTLMFSMGPAAIVTTMQAGDVHGWTMDLRYDYQLAMIWPLIWAGVMAIRLKPRIDAKKRQARHK